MDECKPLVGGGGGGGGGGSPKGAGGYLPVRDEAAAHAEWLALMSDRPWTQARYRTEQALLQEAKMRSGRRRLAIEGAHGLWELSVVQRHHGGLPEGAVTAVVAALEAGAYTRPLLSSTPALSMG